MNTQYRKNLKAIMEKSKEYTDNIYSLSTNNIAGKDTSTNILAKTSDSGIWVGSDTGKWYYWDVSQYVDGGEFIANGENVLYHDGVQLKDINDNNIYPNIDADSIPSKLVSIEKIDDGMIDVINGGTSIVGNITTHSRVGYLRTDGTFSNDTSYNCLYTNFIVCKEGDKFLYKGFAQYSGASAIFYDEDFEILSFIQSSTSNNFIVVTIPANAKFVRFCSFAVTNTNVVFEVITLNSIIRNIEKNEEHITYAFNNTIHYNESSGYLKIDNSFSTDNRFHCKYTDYIECEAGDIYVFNGFAQWSGASAIYFNSNYEIISYEQCDDSKTYQRYTCPANSKYVRFGSFANSDAQIVFDVYRIDNVVTSPLNKKKWCVFGDSFTAGDILGKSKAYPSLICKRNKMLLQDFSKNGAYIHYGTDSPLNSSNSYYYQNIDNDVDYITIAYGLNELSTTIGTKESTDNTTIWGAYIELLTWLITNRPNAKIGIISNDAWMNVTMRNTLQSIALRFGVSFLDLKGKNTPLLIGGKYSEDNTDVSSDIVALRNTQYKVSSENSHPNETSQNLRSYIIEDWLKSI